MDNKTIYDGGKFDETKPRVVNIKATVYKKDIYDWKKKHPCLWKIRQFLKWISNGKIRIDVR